MSIVAAAIVAASVTLATLVTAPASAAPGGSASAWQSPAATHYAKTTTKPRRKPKRVLRCILLGRYYPECHK